MADFINPDDLDKVSRSLHSSSGDPAACRQKFLKHFPGGFYDPIYLATERGYKEEAHKQFTQLLNKAALQSLFRSHLYIEAADRLVRIEGKTHLLYAFEKMALRDSLKSIGLAQPFARGLYEFIYGEGGDEQKFENWIAVIARLPKFKSRVLTWPVVTVAGFIARPDIHIYLKPKVTQRAAKEYGFDFIYSAKPSWEIYKGFLQFAALICKDLEDLQPRDMIDIQSFIWVLGSDEYD